MKGYLTLLIALVAAILLFAVPLRGIDGVPKMTTVLPDTGKAGDIIVVEGEFLGKTHVAEVYLTDGSKDWKVQVIEQSATAIKFKIPANVKSGRLRLMVLTTGPEPKFIEEPVMITIES